MQNEDLGSIYLETEPRQSLNERELETQLQQGSSSRDLFIDTESRHGSDNREETELSPGLNHQSDTDDQFSHCLSSRTGSIKSESEVLSLSQGLSSRKQSTTRSDFSFSLAGATISGNHEN